MNSFSLKVISYNPGNEIIHKLAELSYIGPFILKVAFFDLKIEIFPYKGQNRKFCSVEIKPLGRFHSIRKTKFQSTQRVQRKSIKQKF